MNQPSDWRALLSDFAARRMTGAAFETAFLAAWRRDRGARVTVPYAIDRLFYQVDAYCADPAVRTAGDLDDDDLHQAAIRALADFDAPWPEKAGSAKRPADRRLH